MNIDLNQFLLNHAVPPQYIWAVYAGLAIVGILMMLYGKTLWRVTVGLAGAGAGYYLVSVYLASYVASLQIPLYIWELSIAILLGVLLSFLVRLAISGSIGYGVFYLLQHYQPSFYHPATATIMGYTIAWETVAIALVVFVIAYVLYKYISILIAGMVGALEVYIGLAHFIAPIYTVIPIVIFLPVGLYLQFKRNHGFRDAHERHRAEMREAKRMEKLQRRLRMLQAQSVNVSINNQNTQNTVGGRQHGPQ